MILVRFELSKELSSLLYVIIDCSLSQIQFFSNIKPIRRDLIEVSENKMRQCIYETTVAGCCSRSRTEPVLDVAQKCFSTGYNNFN